MPRDLSALEATPFDVVVIGGGSNGAAVARDAALRGLSVALVEKEDFGYGTVSRSTRLIHGGLRYLELFDFGLVREGLREREILLRTAPAPRPSSPVSHPRLQGRPGGTVEAAPRHAALRRPLVGQIHASPPVSQPGGSDGL